MLRSSVKAVDSVHMGAEKPTGSAQAYFENLVGCGENLQFLHKNHVPVSRLMRNQFQRFLSVNSESSTLSTPPTTITTNTYIKD